MIGPDGNRLSLEGLTGLKVGAVNQAHYNYCI